jgi:two-component system, OmpR family, response regulator ChvI
VSKKNYDINNGANKTNINPNIQNDETERIFRILIVDDDPDIMGSFKAGLTDYNTIGPIFGQNTKLQIDTYTSSKSALSDFKAGIYDLLLLDIKMPDINGFELYEELKKIDAKPKVCFITAFETYYEVLKNDFPELDIGCFIKKPISLSDLAIRLKAELEL